MGTLKGKSRLSMTTMPQHHLDICDRFRLVRLEKGYTQTEFAEKLGLTLSYVKMVEVRSVTPNLYAIKQMRAVFGCSYDWILDGKGKK